MATSALYSPYKIPALVAAFVTVLDQATKLLVIKYIPYGTHEVLIRDFFHLVHFRNTGAAWGMFKGQSLLLAVLSLVILAILVQQFRNLADMAPERAVALALIAGGIVGNLIDRLLRGEVVDFLHFFWRKYQWPAFNVADSAITCGVIAYIVSTIFRPCHESASE